MSKTKSKVEKTVRTVSRKVEKVKKLGWEPPTPQKRPKSVWQNGKKAAKVVSPSLVWIRFLIRASKLRLKTKNDTNYSETSKSRSGTHLKRIVFKGSAGLENNTWTSLLKPLNTASQWVKRFQLTVRGWRKTWAHKSRCVHTEAERQAAEVFSASCEAKQTSRYSRSWAVPRNFSLLMLHVWAACMRHLFALS